MSNQLEIVKRLLERDPDRVLQLYKNKQLRADREVLDYVADHFGLEKPDHRETATKFRFAFPKLGDCELMAVYKKGKKKDAPYRFQFQFGHEVLMVYLDADFRTRENDGENVRKRIEYTHNLGQNSVNQAHIRNGVYNYYKQDFDRDTMVKMFRDMIHELIESDPLIPQSSTSMVHVEYSKTDTEFVYDYDDNPVK